MEAASFIAFMRGIGFTFQEVLKMLLLVGFNFVFIGILFFMGRKYIVPFLKSMYEAMQTIPKLQKSFEDHNEAQRKRNEISDRRFEEVNARLLANDEKFIEQNEILKKQNETIISVDSRVLELAQHVRYFKTRKQLPDEEIPELIIKPDEGGKLN